MNEAFRLVRKSVTSLGSSHTPIVRNGEFGIDLRILEQKEVRNLGLGYQVQRWRRATSPRGEDRKLRVRWGANASEALQPATRVKCLPADP